MKQEELLQDYDLAQLATLVERYRKPCIAFWLSDIDEAAKPPRSKLGGSPRLPPDFVWPNAGSRPLDFLLQIDLSDIALIDPQRTLPSAGLLSFFYDLENQPWGFDPKDLSSFCVTFTDHAGAVPRTVPHPEYQLRELALEFGPAWSLPHIGSRTYERLAREAGISNAEWERFFDFQHAYEFQVYPQPSGLHRLFGYSANIQGDMQLEAELVTNGLYCGDSSGYRDFRREAREHAADEWELLLQLDSDDRAGLMWGDVGMLYWWIRHQDLIDCKFDKVWMALQCY